MHFNIVADGLGDLEKHIHNWDGNHLRPGPVLTSERVERLEAVLRLRQGPPAAGGGGGTGAAGHPAADGGSGTASGGGAPEPRDIEFTRKISALEAKIEQLEERNANLEDSLQRLDFKFSSLLVEQLEERNANLENSLQRLDSKFSSLLAHFMHFASSLPSF